MKLSRIISTAISLALGLSLVVPAYAAESGFTDVDANAYYADAVSWAVDWEITSGTSATTFSPDATCTKAQILTFIWRANGSPEPDLEKISTADHNPYPDLNGTEYYFKAAQWAYTKGMTAGGMNFNGNEPCSRSLAVTYLWEEAGEPQPTKEAGFTDIIRALHDLNAISWAVEKRITSGTSDTTFSPDATCTRGQIVTFLYRADQAKKSDFQNSMFGSDYSGQQDTQDQSYEEAKQAFINSLKDHFDSSGLYVEDNTEGPMTEADIEWITGTLNGGVQKAQYEGWQQEEQRKEEERRQKNFEELLDILSIPVGEVTYDEDGTMRYTDVNGNMVVEPVDQDILDMTDEEVEAEYNRLMDELRAAIGS